MGIKSVAAGQSGAYIPDTHHTIASVAAEMATDERRAKAAIRQMKTLAEWRKRATVKQEKRRQEEARTRGQEASRASRNLPKAA